MLLLMYIFECKHIAIVSLSNVKTIGNVCMKVFIILCLLFRTLTLSLFRNKAKLSQIFKL